MSVKNRLKIFINYKKLSILAFEKSIKASNGYVSSISKGIGNAKMKSISEIYPELNRSWLLFNEGQMLNVDKKLKNNNGNTFEETKDGNFIITVDLIPFSAYASYVETLEQGLEPTNFDKTSFVVDKFGKGSYKAFRVKGDSMNNQHLYDTPDGCLVLGRELGRQHWLDGFKKNLYGWVIICEKGIFHKDITGLDNENGTITCHSRNASPEYSDFKLELNRIKQIFKILKRTF